VELPGIETDALPGNLGSERPVRSIEVQLSTARYLRFRFQVLAASMLTIYCPGSQDWSDWSGSQESSESQESSDSRDWSGS
jgi:hypothetical protein